MTVKELIEELQCYEEDKEVWIMVDGSYAVVDDVDLDAEDETIIIR